MNAIDFSQYFVMFILIIIMFIPARYVYYFLIILALFDTSGPDFPSSSQIGILNVLKTIFLPLLLIIRFRFKPLATIVRRKKPLALYAFLLFALYALMATLWSPYKLSALKMVGFFLGYLLWFTVIMWGWLSKKIDIRLVKGLFFLSIVLGIFQSTILDSSFGTEEQRFTAFISPQEYAALVVITSIIIFTNSNQVKRLEKHLVLITALVVVFLTGSRTYFISLILSILILWLISWKDLYRRLLPNITILIVGKLIILLTILIFAEQGIGSSRTAELRYIVSAPERIGTLTWRIGMYHETLRGILSAGIPELLVGHGTSSGADIAFRIDSRRYLPETIDANRVIHNEFLRSLYEWGILGLTLILFITIYIIISAFWLSFRSSDHTLLAAMPPFIAGLLVENVLAFSASGWGIGVILVIGLTYAKRLEVRREHASYYCLVNNKAIC